MLDNSELVDELGEARDSRAKPDVDPALVAGEGAGDSRAEAWEEDKPPAAAAGLAATKEALEFWGERRLCAAAGPVWPAPGDGSDEDASWPLEPDCERGWPLRVCEGTALPGRLAGTDLDSLSFAAGAGDTDASVFVLSSSAATRARASLSWAAMAASMHSASTVEFAALATRCVR